MTTFPPFKIDPNGHSNQRLSTRTSTKSEVVKMLPNGQSTFNISQQPGIGEGFDVLSFG
ncbi:hypothetical protein [Xanthocytophaga agilis]|uniref:Uncharacterized protein n=1 Tax=Xanthocytophaga agilis TaxID=3048010 RepID=A0AAE3UIM9_9BACT|nr:hypothetical protein [Xanthocytophaga agilis]MDJ1505591.1 hypothetical protein [Xanthocytophaga agilis]